MRNPRDMAFRKSAKIDSWRRSEETGLEPDGFRIEGRRIQRYKMTTTADPRDQGFTATRIVFPILRSSIPC